MLLSINALLAKIDSGGCKALSMCMRCALQEACQDCEGGQRTVSRIPELRDNSSLPAVLQRRAGDAIYAGLRNGYRVGLMGQCEHDHKHAQEYPVYNRACQGSCVHLTVCAQLQAQPQAPKCT